VVIGDVRVEVGPREVVLAVHMKPEGGPVESDVELVMSNLDSVAAENIDKTMLRYNQSQCSECGASGRAVKGHIEISSVPAGSITVRSLGSTSNAFIVTPHHSSSMVK
jgi:hypothetical protein